MKKVTIISLIIIALSASGLIFILDANDHAECSTVEKSMKLENGSVVKETSHICKEKYNL